MQWALDYMLRGVKLVETVSLTYITKSNIRVKQYFYQKYFTH